LIRAVQDRSLAEDQQQMVSWVEQQPVAGIQQIQVPRHGRQAARAARLEVRFAQARLQPTKSNKSLGALAMWAVLPQEMEAPPGITPLRSMLLTTSPVESFEAACQKLRWSPTSPATGSPPPSHPHCEKQCGWRLRSVVFSGAKATASRERKPCGLACGTSLP
jgi:hypothetical protein